jgi:long-chain acyl-CoA synthetase
MRVDDLLRHSARRSPQQTAVVWGAERRSYAQIDEQAQRLARELVEGGVRPGHRVAIYLAHPIETIVSIFAVATAGAAFVVVNPKTKREHLETVLAASGATALIEQSGTRCIRVLHPPPVSPRQQVPADLAALIYTSGSNGTPKGVMLTHGNIVFAAATISSYLENRPDDVILSVLPLSSTYGLGQVMTAFAVGATLVLERSFAYARAVVETLQREKVTGMPLVPTLATMMLQVDLTQYEFPHLRYITSASAALPVPKLRRLQAAFPAVRIYSMYGQTECQRVSYLPPEMLETHPDSVGLPLRGTEVAIVDERGRPVAPGVVGELVVSGPHVMSGYWNQPEATKAALRADASGTVRLHTGDLFRRDENGLLYFVERKDDIIKTRGEKVAPRQVEEMIARLPGVAEVSVYGVPDEMLGEAIAAVVTPVRGAGVTSQAIRRHCSEHLADFMVPKFVEIRDILPTTASGKVSRRALQATAMGAQA